MKALPLFAMLALLFPTLVLAAPLPIATLDRTEPVGFYREILPFLKKNCLACHNETKAKANLILETPEAILKGGDTGPAVVPGDPDASLLFTTSIHVEEPTMPPAKNKSKAENLTPEQLALLRLWIQQGAESGGSALAAAPQTWIINPQQAIYAVAVSPDGRFVACGRGHGIQIYDLRLNRLVANLTDPDLKSLAHRDFVHELAFSPDGTLASGGYRVIKLWERPSLLPSSLSKLETVPAHPLPEALEALRPKLDLLPDLSRELESLTGQEAMAKRLSALYAKEVPTLEAAWKKEGEAGEAAAKKIPPGRQKVAEASRKLQSQQRVLDLATARKRSEEELTKQRTELEKLENELAAARREVELAVRNQDLAAKLTGEAASRLALAQSRKASADAALEALTARREALTKQRTEALPKLEVAGGVFLPGDEIAVLALKTGEIHLYSAAEGKHLESFTTGSTVAAVELDPAGLAVIAAEGERTVWDVNREWTLQGRIGDAADGKVLQDRVLALAFSPDGTRLASGTGIPSRTGILQLWDPRTGQPLASNPEAHSDTITDLAFSPHGDQLVSGSTDRFAKIFHSDSLEHVRSFEAHTSHVLGVAWSHDQRRLATSSADTEAKLWDVESGEQVRTHKGWKKELTAVSFLTPASEQILTASGDGSLKVDTSAISGSSGFLHAATVSADGQWIVAGGDDGVLRVWTASDRKLAFSYEPPEQQLARN